MKTLLTPKDLATSLKLSLATISRMSLSGALPAILIASGPRKKTYRYDESEIEAWLKERRQGTRGKAGSRRAIRNGNAMATGNGGISQPIEATDESERWHLPTRQVTNAEQRA
jgi:hypothetical protein